MTKIVISYILLIIAVTIVLSYAYYVNVWFGIGVNISLLIGVLISNEIIDSQETDS